MIIKRKNIIKVAIDSPAAAGAGTLAKEISKHYDLFYLDTGKIYRMIAYLKIKFPKKDDCFEDLPIDFVIKCNKLVCALLLKISKNNLNYDFELIKPEFYLIDLCSDFAQYKSLVKSVIVNFDILHLRFHLAFR